MAKINPRYVSTFRAPTEYERQLEEARRRAAMAEALAQQEYQPMEGTAAPIPAAAPLVKALQGFMTARAGRQAEEAKAAAEKAGRTEAVDYMRSFDPEQRTVGVGDIAAMEASRPYLEGGQLRYDPASAVAAPNQRLMPAMTPTGEIDVSQPMQMQVGGPLSIAQKRARALEGFESVNPMVRDFAVAQYEKTMPKELGLKIGDIDPGKFTAESIAAAMKSNDISKLIYRKEPAKDERTTSIKDYEYAKNQGFTGTFAQWEQQNRAAGAARFVMPSEGERQDTYNLNRIISAQKRIRDAVEKDPTAIAPSGKEAFVSAIPGAAEYSYLSQGPQRQVVSAAQSEIIDAVLTLATGLSYTPVQLEAQRAAYLPKWNESPESRAAKYQAIRSLVDSAKVRAGRAWTSEMDNAIEEAFAPIAPKSTEPTPFTSAQQRRLDELERKAMQRGTGGPR